MTSGLEHRKAILERRAERTRNLAEMTASVIVGLELESLAALYDDSARRLVARAQLEAAQHGQPREVEESVEGELMDFLRRKSEDFLRRSRESTDRRESEDLRHLSAVFGAEVARLRNDHVR